MSRFKKLLGAGIHPALARHLSREYSDVATEQFLGSFANKYFSEFRYEADDFNWFATKLKNYKIGRVAVNKVKDVIPEVVAKNKKLLFLEEHDIKLVFCKDDLSIIPSSLIETTDEMLDFYFSKERFGVKCQYLKERYLKGFSMTQIQCISFGLHSMGYSLSPDLYISGLLTGLYRVT